MRKTKSPNLHLRKMIASLKKLSNESNVKIWDAIAENLSKPTRIRRQINLTKLESYAKDGDTIIVPGKVLGTGTLSKKVTVSAWRFSDSAFTKINKIGKAISIDELMAKNPKGSKVRIFG
jgi:large subunit ribosomal protein L18e